MTFRELLNISNEKEYMLNIFDYYANSNELIEKNITEEERKKLITLVN